jgi:hypothetical protein
MNNVSKVGIVYVSGGGLKCCTTDDWCNHTLSIPSVPDFP